MAIWQTSQTEHKSELADLSQSKQLDVQILEHAKLRVVSLASIDKF